MPNGNQRGNSHSRRLRKLWLLKVCGDGISAPCWECLTLVTFESMVVDRIIPAHQGGTYARNNIRVHCHVCSNREGAKFTNMIRYTKWDSEQWLATTKLREVSA